MEYSRHGLSETILTTIVAILVMVLVWGLLAGDEITSWIPAVAVGGLVVIAFVIIRTTISPDHVRATQISKTLKLSSKTLEHMRNGLNEESAQAVCKLLLPFSQARAIAITNTNIHLGFSGNRAIDQVSKTPLFSKEMFKVLENREMMVITNPQSLALQGKHAGFVVEAVVIAPLVVRNVSIGSIKFYYDAKPQVDKTQIAIIRGFTELLSTQLSMSELDKQSELRTRAELRALQSQINPHFLFNTINTIAALIRTDPKRARELLREFSFFYRQTLESSESFITIEKELKQTMRYVMFEKARFGDDTIVIKQDIEEGLENTKVPSFIIQPIIENSVQHGMRSGVPLTISIKVYKDYDDVVISISDDGVGMSDENLHSMGKARKSDSKGTGIALRNVAGRLKGFFDSDSSMTIESELNHGTTTTMRLGGAARDKGEEKTDA